MVLTSDELGISSGSNEGYEDGKPRKADEGSTMGSQSDGKAAPAGTKIGMTDIHDAQAHVSHDKRLIKKPNKPLPCPRCESMDTKFCYFNNYNVNQPRHLCRKCQRYWTAGGSLRKVPVGAGRRKSKHAASHQKHVIMPDMEAIRIDGGDVAHGRITGNHSKVGPSQPQSHLLPLEVGSFTAMDSSSSGIMLSFGHQLCESVTATSLSMQRGATIEHQGSLNGQSALPAYGDTTADSENGWSVDCKKGIITPSNRCHETSSAPAKFQSMDTSAEGSSVTRQWSQKNDHVHSTLSELANKANAEANAHALQETGTGSYACSGPWHHFNLALKNPSAVAVNSAVSLPAPNCWAWNGAPGGMWGSFPWPCMPPAMWDSPPFNWTSAWSMPWGPAAAVGAVVAAAAAATAAGAATPSSSTAQKHRLESSQVSSRAEGCLWVPKTLRINDPDEAARSSIWTTLGLGDGPGSLAVGGVVTKAFQCKSETKDGDESTTQSRHSNPAAMSRSMAFNENN